MNNPRFYRLGEQALEKLMSESDIYTLVRAKSLVLLAEIPQTSALITLHNDKKVVVGKAQVQGLAILRNKDALELLEHWSRFNRHCLCQL